MDSSEVTTPQRFTFDRSQRLTKRSEFDSVLQMADFSLQICPIRILGKSNTLTCARLGLIVSKRNIPKAVHRNRAKRIVREWFRFNASTLGSIDLVVRVGSYQRPGDSLHSALMQLLPKVQRQAQRFKENSIDDA